MMFHQNEFTTKLKIALFVTSVFSFVQSEGIKYERISIKAEVEFEQNISASLSIPIPGSPLGIYNSAISQNGITEQGKESDGLCRIVRDQVSLIQEQSGHINISELNPLSEPFTKFIKTGLFSSSPSTVFLITNQSEVFKVNTETQKLVGVAKFNAIITENSVDSKDIHIVLNTYSDKLYIISKNAIASLNNSNQFDNSSFEREGGFTGQKQVLHALSFNDYIVLSCGSDGLVIFKASGQNNALIMYKKYQYKSKYAAFHKETKTIAFLDDTGIRFIQINSLGVFSNEASSNTLQFQDVIAFSHWNLQTFWIPNQQGFMTSEVIFDGASQIPENNGAHPQKYKIITTHLSKQIGIVINQNEYLFYIHSIPRGIVSELRDKIARFSIENIIDAAVVESEGPSSEQILFNIIGITEKTLRFNSLLYKPPTFECDPRETPGKFEYKLRIYSKECEKGNSQPQFYQCLIDDLIVINVNQSYMTSSEQQKAIIFSVIALSLVALIILIFYTCYRIKQKELGEMENKARDLRKLKYLELQQEKALNISENNI